MAFCVNCGKQLENGIKFCGGCGTAVGGQAAASAFTPASPMAVAQNTTSIMAKSFRCSGCGESLKIPQNPREVVRCPSCRTECVMDGIIKNAEIAAKENITGGIPLTASLEQLHETLIWKVLYNNPILPLDFFDKAEVIREEHYCVPGYCFYCNGTSSFTYDVANVRSQVVVRDNGEKSWEETRSREEWDNGKSSTAAISKTIFTSANKELREVISLYSNYDPKNLVDIEDLEFPADVVTYKSDLPQTVAFNEFIVPDIELELECKAMEMLEKQKTRDLQMGGANIQKETVRVFLGLYRIIFKYGGKEYYMWITGHGKFVRCNQVPTDSQRKKNIEQLKKVVSEKENAKKSISNGWDKKSILWAFIIGGFLAGLVIIQDFTASILGGCLGAVVYYMILRTTKVNYDAQIAEANKKIAKAQNDLDKFEGQLKDAIKRFNGQKKFLNGIYNPNYNRQRAQKSTTHAGQPSLQQQYQPQQKEFTWYVHLNDNQYQFDSQLLKQYAQSNHITCDTLVWKEGMEQWAMAGDCKELQHLFGK